MILKLFKVFIDYKCWFFDNLFSLNDLKNLISFNSLNSSFSFNIFCSLKLKILNSLFDKFCINYYMSDIYSKNSKVMALSSSKVKNMSFSVSTNLIFKYKTKNISFNELFYNLRNKNKILLN